MVIKRGDIFYADLRPVVGSEQGGIRPVLIIQNDIGNKHSPTVICAAITSRMNKADLTILRLAVYEMKWDEDIPTGVAINEAVELARKFGGSGSPAFVNGILGKLAELEPQE